MRSVLFRAAGAALLAAAAAAAAFLLFPGPGGKKSPDGLRAMPLAAETASAVSEEPAPSAAEAPAPEEARPAGVVPRCVSVTVLSESGAVTASTDCSTAGELLRELGIDAESLSCRKTDALSDGMVIAASPAPEGEQAPEGPALEAPVPEEISFGPAEPAAAPEEPAPPEIPEEVPAESVEYTEVVERFPEEEPGPALQSPAPPDAGTEGPAPADEPGTAEAPEGAAAEGPGLPAEVPVLTQVQASPGLDVPDEAPAPDGEAQAPEEESGDSL